MLVSDCCAVEKDFSGRELVDHGSLQFPLAIYHDHLENMPVDWHWHDEFELIYQIDGEGQYIVHDAKLILKKGQGLFINGGALHGGWPTELCHSDLCSLVFHPRLIYGGNESIFFQKYIGPLTHNPGFLFYHFQGEEVIWAQEIRRIWEICLEGQEGYELQVRNRLSDLFFFLFQKQVNRSTLPSPRILRNSERIKQMLNFIHDNYSNPIRVADIAASAMLSESECLRCFRDIVHNSPGQYLKNYRISKACEQLKNSTLTINQIGELCGFSDQSYFVKQFREAIGVTPGGYRKKEHAN